MQGLYAIVDLPHPHGLTVEAITAAVLGSRLEGGRDGASVVQLRAKAASTAERVALLGRMAPLCRRAGVPLWVDDDVDAALEAGVDGVHLGQDDPGADDPSAVRDRAAAEGRALRVGLSTHDLGQLREAGRRSPDYLALGPVAPTRSKANPEPVVGWSTLLDGCRVASRPLVAIGGLDRLGGCRAIEAGASAVAVIGALIFEDPGRIREQAIVLARAFEAAAAPLELDEVHRRIPVLPPQQLAELARWGDALGVHIGLGLPARFAPRMVDGRPLYRNCDVLDLLMALGKHPAESWDQWRERGRDEDGPLVQLRSRQTPP
ncbi:MAG: thiamine phosphate synthase [Myxococcales bacterium]|nr:thiamine phosphate synthase [Myxococcales bacterium]